MILSTAATLFAQRGFGAVTLEDIGAAVGVSGPAIYKHFRGKDALLREVIVAHTSNVASSVGDSALDADAILHHLADALLDDVASLTTSVRELMRLREIGGLKEWTAASGRISSAWQRVMDEVNPRLDAQAIAIRFAAVLGAAVGLALLPVEVPRPRLDELFAASVTSIASCKAAPLDKPSGARTWQPPLTRHDEVFRAASALFRERGYGGVAVSEIGIAAGISGPTLYHYYETKAEILLEIYDRSAQHLNVAIDDALTTAASAADAVERLVRSFVSFAMTDSDLLIVAERERESIPDEARLRLGRTWLGIEDRWSAIVGECRSDLPESEIRLLVRMAFPLMSQAVSLGNADQRRRSDVVAVTLAHLLSKAS